MKTVNQAIGVLRLRVELRRRRGRTIARFVFPHPLDEPGSDGHPIRGDAQVSARTLRKALQTDLRNNPSIKHVSVNITGEARRAQLYLKIELAPTADLPAIHSYVAGALHRFHMTSQICPVITETMIHGV